MAENQKYYWLKLKRDFFKRHDIRIIEEMPNGKDYILFYLKLFCRFPEICKHIAPQYQEETPGHFVACHCYSQE